MASINLHGKPFDETTKVKLDIFENYAQAWIPTFVMRPGTTRIYIFDFFAGTGYDTNKVEGSPIRLLNKIREQLGHIFQKKIKVFLYLNEFDEDKNKLLHNACKEYLEQHKDVGRAINLEITQEDFAVCFPKQLPYIKEFPSLVYLDQNGVKFLKNEYFSHLTLTNQVDFLYFAASSYLKRFGSEPEMQGIINPERIRKSKVHQCHRILVEEIKTQIPQQSKLKLYPFSLKKGHNVYGIIFGASNPAAIDKFLKLAWKVNPLNGNANYDIEDEVGKRQLTFFNDKLPTKIEAFKDKLSQNLLNGILTTNKDVLDFTYEEGHIHTHAVEVIKAMKNDKQIHYEGSSPLITYENVYRNKKIINYTLL